MIKNCQPLNLTTIFSQSNCFIIDSFQRNYEWGKDQWNDFIESIYNTPLDKVNHGEFMGSIISYKDNKGMHICDGQQRLTTAYVICLYICNNTNERSILRKAENIVMNNDFNYRLRFFNEKDDKGVERCFNKNINKKDGSNIEKFYAYLEKKFDGLTTDEYKILLTRLLDNMCFAFIECVDETSAIKVFNNQSKGKSLGSEDLLNAQLHSYIIGMTGSLKDIDERRHIKEMINYAYKDKKDKWFLNIFVATQSNKSYQQKDALDALESLTDTLSYEEIIKNLKEYYEECRKIETTKISNFKLPNNETIINLYRFLYLNKNKEIIEYQYRDKLFRFFRNLIINTIIDKNKPGSFHINKIIDVCVSIIKDEATPTDYFNYLGILSGELCLDVNKETIQENFISYNSYKNKDFGNFMLHALQDTINKKEIGVRIENETIDHISPKSLNLVDDILINSIGNLTILSHSSNASKNNRIDECSFNEIHTSTLPINRWFDKFNSVEEFTDEEIRKRGKYIYDMLYDEFFNYDLYK